MLQLNGLQQRRQSVFRLMSVITCCCLKQFQALILKIMLHNEYNRILQSRCDALQLYKRIKKTLRFSGATSTRCGHPQYSHVTTWLLL